MLTAFALRDGRPERIDDPGERQRAPWIALFTVIGERRVCLDEREIPVFRLPRRRARPGRRRPGERAPR